MFKELVNCESRTQDGFRVLYAILSLCHPKLVERSNMKQPTLKLTPNIFTFITHLRNWFEFEKVQHRHYSDMEQLTIAMEEMETDSRFEKALSLLRMKRQLHKNFMKTSLFCFLRFLTQ